MGTCGVGKSSLVSLLKGKGESKVSTPTIGLDIKSVQISENKLVVWDFGGQSRFKHMWGDFLRGAGLTVLVCDSTEENLKKTKEIYNRFSRSIGCKIIAIANKQDLPGALSADMVQKKLGVKTYEMSAIRTELMNRMKDILDYEINSD